jgi:hypothetical protein
LPASSSELTMGGRIDKAPRQPWVNFSDTGRFDGGPRDGAPRAPRVNFSDTGRVDVLPIAGTYIEGQVERSGRSSSALNEWV